MHLILDILRRTWDVPIGLLMIGLSLLLQMLMFAIIGFLTVPILLKTWGIAEQTASTAGAVSFVGLFVLFNGISCLQYFRRQKVIGMRTADGRLRISMPGSADQVSMAMFLVPRGLHRVFAGRERMV